MEENKNQNTEPLDGEVIEDYQGMSKFKAAFLKCLPMLIVIACVGLFALGVKWIAGTFYAPKDTVYEKDGFQIVHCYQTPSSYYYIYPSDFVFTQSEYDNVGGEHEDAHFIHDPLAYFILNETALNIENTTVKQLTDGNGLTAFQFGEFVLYKLEGQFGVFAPLRDYEESATSRKNDLYVVRQLMKNDVYKGFELPDWETEEGFLARLEKIEWFLDTEYIEDN